MMRVGKAHSEIKSGRRVHNREELSQLFAELCREYAIPIEEGLMAEDFTFLMEEGALSHKYSISLAWHVQSNGRQIYCSSNP